MTYQLKWLKRGVIATFSGVFSAMENSRANTEVYSDIRSDTLQYQIWDLSSISDIKMTESQVDIPAFVDKMASHRLPNIKMALVTRDEKTKKLCNKYIYTSVTSGSPWQFQIFNSLEEAKKWVSS
jgi:hypothetical protein